MAFRDATPSTTTSSTTTSTRRPDTSSLKPQTFEGILDKIEFSFPSHTLLCGVTGSGKTKILLHFIALHGDKFDKQLYFVGSGRFSSDYDWVPRGDMFPVDRAVAVLTKVISIHEGLAAKGVKYNVLLVFDDFLGALSLNGKGTAQIFQQLATSGRHLGISCIFLTQKITSAIPTTLRDNTANWILCRVPTSSLKIAWEYQNCYTEKTSVNDFIRDTSAWMANRYHFCYWNAHGGDNYDKLYFLKPVPLVRFE